MLTHSNLIANIVVLEGVEGPTFTSKDVINGVLPFFHVSSIEPHVRPSSSLTNPSSFYQIYGMQVLMNLTLW